jgi:hypothetical protein
MGETADKTAVAQKHSEKELQAEKINEGGRILSHGSSIS